ncbi:hypothetical protein [Halomonas stenophila]|uniref:Uncharacterized protein n=1 Tax=Halomonas stenophila TaxID=795312 RepID=A0A7W5EU42_9GAMM|nr:hypothetical protein [Halomonas stenophila]MBB3231458.1 hypothetical protein [Halomonas stenophila]
MPVARGAWWPSGETPQGWAEAGWPGWFRRCHAPVARGFWGVFYLLVVAFPSTLLYLQGYLGWLIVYLVSALVLLGLHASCAQRVLRSLDSAG